ncbi:MAG: hypothetical protein JW816_02970 [Candidatus Buchananbacteria bacterium]|nr:hypothetical protein [Candidatus Buchananbacteria bacterium]
MEKINEFITIVALLMGVRAYLNASRLQKRFNKLEESLQNKGIVVEKDLWPN